MSKSTPELDAKKASHTLVPFGLLELHSNPRTDKLGDIKALAANIAENGLKQPLRGYLNNGYYAITDGLRRYKALELLSKSQPDHDVLKGIPFFKIDAKGDEIAIMVDQLVSNDGLPLTPLEKAGAVKFLFENGLNSKDISTKLAISTVYVNELKRLANLPDKVKKLIRDGKISFTLVREWMKSNTLDTYIEQIEAGTFVVPTNEEEGQEFSDEVGVSKPTKVTSRAVTINSVAEFKRFMRQFSEVFPEGKVLGIQEVYDFVCKIMRNELAYSEIAKMFSDDGTATAKAKNPTAKVAAPKKVKEGKKDKKEPEAKGGKKGTSRKVLYDKDAEKANGTEVENDPEDVIDSTVAAFTGETDNYETEKAYNEANSEDFTTHEELQDAL